MVFLPGLAVIFVGIVGGDHKVDRQVKAVLEAKHVEARPIAAAAVHALANHGEVSRDIIKRLHVDGVVGGELITVPGEHGRHSTLTLRLAIYAGDGGLKSFAEVPMSGRLLSSDELEVLSSNLDDDVGALVAAIPAVAPATPAATPPPRPIVAPPAPHQPAPPPSDELEFAPDAVGHEAAPAPHPAAATRTAEASDAVSADEIESLTAGGDGDPGPTAIATESGLHLRAGVGIAVASRTFAGPTTVPGYASSPVGAIHLDAAVQPTLRTTLAVVAERTFQMSTPMSAGMAPTSMSRWEVAARYAVVHGVVELAPEIGLGRRSFSIDSTDPSRSPDSDYNYLILGMTAATALGSHVSLHAMAAFEPVMSGAEPTEMAFGEASRWALDLGAAVEVRPRAHVFVRAAVGYQRFTWSWDLAGARGAGGAVDDYPSAALSAGAEY